MGVEGGGREEVGAYKRRVEGREEGEWREEGGGR